MARSGSDSSGIDMDTEQYDTITEYGWIPSQYLFGFKASLINNWNTGLQTDLGNNIYILMVVHQ